MLPRDRRPEERLLVLGHRGSPKRARENTIESFRKAMEEGADGTELDVRPTKDNHLVVSHDDNLKRVYGVDMRISEITRQELLEIAPEIPELSDVFEALGPIVYDIEIKADKPLARTWAANRLLWDELQKHKELWEGIIVSSFNPLALREFGRISGNALPMGLIYEGNSPSFRRLTNHAQGRIFFKCSFLKPKEDILTEERNRKPKWTMCPWTVDTRERLLEALETSSPLVITNDPEGILRILREVYPR